MATSQSRKYDRWAYHFDGKQMRRVWVSSARSHTPNDGWRCLIRTTCPKTGTRTMGKWVPIASLYLALEDVA